jgi:hypothetical protein
VWERCWVSSPPLLSSVRQRRTEKWTAFSTPVSENNERTEHTHIHTRKRNHNSKKKYIYEKKDDH